MNNRFSILSSCAASGVDTAADWHRNITALTVPTEAYLFEKKIPLENWEVRERFEREFYYNYTNADQLLLWWKRLRRWEPMIDSMLDAAGLSRDFKYLMIAESGARNVQSPARANGYWQFIAPTAQRWGLRVDQYIDDRLDPILSTQAAIRYLLKLKAEFNGDYFLSAAGYNMGEEGVEEALAYQKQSGYWNLYVNEETMRYPLRIAVIKEFLEHGQKYGFQFEKMTPYKRHSLKIVSVQGPISSIADWALSVGYTYKDVKMFNPRFIAKNIPSGSYEIRLPANDSERTTVR
ncbi:MAG: lytic transglycosylase domain-containing protein [Bacteroidota bacterium]|nr:lytic transglycosylase domain-containing protein [Bacteroidota bacterium]MDP4231061.1 lytic transglycosylase domain-containing protein [Bacteroidota bacterium]